MINKAFSNQQENKMSIFEQIVSIVAVSSVSLSVIINMAKFILPALLIILPLSVPAQSMSGDKFISEAEFIQSLKYLSTPVIIRDTIVVSNNTLQSSFDVVSAQVEQDIANIKAVMSFILLLVTAILFLAIKTFYTIWRFLIKNKPTAN